MSTRILALLCFAGGSALSAQSGPLSSSEGPLTGFCWADCDGDGLADALVIAPGARARLLLNQGDGTLRDATVESGLPEELLASFGLWVDVDCDGDSDLLIGSVAGPARLFLDQGAVFEEVGDTGLEHEDAALHAGFFDYDGDALPDLHLLTARASLLYSNLGRGHFESAACVVDEGAGARPAVHGGATGVALAPDTSAGQRPAGESAPNSRKGLAPEAPTRD